MSRTAVFICLLMSQAGILVADSLCAEQLAYDRLLESRFTVERTFEVTVNGKLKKREVARLSFDQGELSTEVLEEEVNSKGMVFETGNKDFAVHSEFACDRLESREPGFFDLRSPDGLEVLTMELDSSRDALRPVAWRMDAEERFLFKKFVIEGRVTYSEFEWR